MCRRQGLQSDVMTLFSDLDEVDGTKDDTVSREQFSDLIKQLTGYNALEYLPAVEIDFLALKYIG